MPIAATQSGGSSYLALLLPFLLILVLYFIMIRPQQQRRRRDMAQTQASIMPGAEVLTVGGLYGVVVGADDEVVELEVAPGVHNRYARQAIARVVTRVESADEADDGEPEDHEPDDLGETANKIIEKRD